MRQLVAEEEEIVISVIIPVFNGESYLDECLQAIAAQRIPPDFPWTSRFRVQISIYDDASTDVTPEIIKKWTCSFLKGLRMEKDEIGLTFAVISSRNETGSPKGVGFARNRAIEQSNGEYLCFCDADDLMLPDRIFKQFNLGSKHQNAIIGSHFTRIPENSTKHFTYWANHLSHKQLYTQAYLSFGPTLIMPSWFCHRQVYSRIPGGFSEIKSGNPEDLLFFYQHLDLGGELQCVREPLLQYRYHPFNTTLSVNESAIWRIRLDRFELHVLSSWQSFTIWNAGKLGRKFYRSLSPYLQEKVSGFCDIDPAKIELGFYHPYPMDKRLPIHHVKNAQPPLVICVKTEMTFDDNGPFRKILASLRFREGVDFFYFN